MAYLPRFTLLNLRISWVQICECFMIRISVNFSAFQTVMPAQNNKLLNYTMSASWLLGSSHSTAKEQKLSLVPKDETTVFVRNIPFDMTDAALTALFGNGSLWIFSCVFS